MPTVTYPSEVNPGPPVLSVQTPDTWEQVPVPQTLIAVREDAPEGVFATNLVARYVQRAATTTPESIVAELGEYVRVKPDGQIGEPYSVELAERPWSAVNLTYTDEQFGEINQMHLFTGEVRGALLSLVQVSVTFGAERAEEQLEVIRPVLASLRAGRPATS